MTKKARPVRQYMTRLPVECERCETVADADHIMQAHEIRHIPVMSGSHLRGVVSQRDILQARVRLGDGAGQVSLEEICQRDVLTVDPLCPVPEVARQMLRRGVGSALVMDGGFVVGVFTTTDALRALAESPN